jgi:lysophospholipase L1-like esterase
VSFLFGPRQRIAFIGDERLSQGNERDVVALTMERIALRGSASGLLVLNLCTDGLSVSQALERAPLEADWVVIAVGMHDALRQTSLEQFEREYRELLGRFTNAVICEPCMLQTEQIAILEPYRAIVARIAFEAAVPLAQFQRALNRVLPTTGADAWGAGLTLNTSGSAVLAEELLGAIGFEVFEDDDEFLTPPAASA